MANLVDDLLENINHQVAKLSIASSPKMLAVLDEAEKELTQALAKWMAMNKSMEKFTPQLYRNALLQIREALGNIKGPMATEIESVLKHNGNIAAALATGHLKKEVEVFSKHFEGSVRPIALDTASVLAEGKKTVWPRFASSATRYAGQVGEDINKQLAIGVVRGENIDQLTNRLVKLGGPKTETAGEGLFKRYRYYAERLARTEVVNAYNTFAMEGMQELEQEDPGYFQRWDAAVDGRTCPYCREYDGLNCKLDGSFPGGIKQPPLHPNCRCCLVVWRKEWTEQKHKHSLESELIKGKEPESKLSLPNTTAYKTPKPSKELLPTPNVHGVNASKKADKTNKPEDHAKAAEQLANSAKLQLKINPEYAAKIQAKADEHASKTGNIPVNPVKSKPIALPKEMPKLKLPEVKSDLEVHKPLSHDKFLSMRDEYTKLIKTNPDQYKAIFGYSSTHYEEINPALREGKVTKSLAGTIKHMDEALEKSLLKENITVYRGLVGPYAEKLRENKPGTIFVEKAYTSTSINKDKILGHGSQHETDHYSTDIQKGTSIGTVLHINVPAGYPAAAIPSAHPKEMEILLKKGTAFRIDKVEGNVVHVTVVEAP